MELQHLTSDQVMRLEHNIVDTKTGKLHRQFVGQSAQRILEAAGIRRMATIRLIVVPLNENDAEGPFAREKMAPVLSLFTVSNEKSGFDLCKKILANEGMGHTAIIHTQDEQLAYRFGLDMPASRILVNCPGSQGCIGMGNGLTPSLTLGCGTWGGTSTTDNVSYKNLINIKRIAQVL